MVHSLIRALLTTIWPAVGDLRIQYGGSVTPETAEPARHRRRPGGQRQPEGRVLRQHRPRCGGQGLSRDWGSGLPPALRAEQDDSPLRLKLSANPDARC